jgi:hypothetical protein
MKTNEASILTFTAISTTLALVVLFGICADWKAGGGTGYETNREKKQAELRKCLQTVKEQRLDDRWSDSAKIGSPLTQDEISACYIAVGKGNDLPRSWRKHYYEGYYR